MTRLLYRFAWPLGLLALLLLFFGPAIAHGAMIAPGDGLGYYLPQRAIAAVAYHQGELPFWNPYNFSGLPLMAVMQGGVFYPGNWPFLFFPTALAMNLAVLGGYYVAALASYLLGRALGLARSASALIGIVYVFSAYMVGHTEHIDMMHCASLYPALFWAIERYRRSGRGPYAVGFGVILALQFLAGYPQSVAISLLFTVPFALFRAWNLPWRDRLRFLAPLGAAAALGLAACAMVILPAGDLLGASPRQTMDYRVLVADAFSPHLWLTLLFPFLYGGTPSALFSTPYWGGGLWIDEMMGYAGIGTLVLATAALGRARVEPALRYWIGAAVVALLLAAGDATPLYHLWAHMPVLKIMRVPGRHTMELDLALGVLAAYGLTAVGRGEARRWALVAWGTLGIVMAAVIGAVGLFGMQLAAHWQPYLPASIDLAVALRLSQPNFWLPVVVWLATGLGLVALFKAPRRVGLALFMLVVIGDLFLYGEHQGWRQRAPHPPADFGAPLSGRMDAERTFAVPLRPYPYDDLRLVEDLRYAADGALFGTRPVSGYEPMVSARYHTLVGGIAHGGDGVDASVWHADHHALDILNTRWVRIPAVLAADPAWRARLSAPRFTLEQVIDGQVDLYRNHRALPRAWRVTQATRLSAADVDHRVTADARFDPAAEALVEEPLETSGIGPGSATLTPLSLNRLEVRTAGRSPGLVVVSEGYDPGWRAFSGARELPVHRVDGLVLGVEVSAGAQAVLLRYEPRRWHSGLLVSSASALALLAWGLWGLARARRAAR